MLSRLLKSRSLFGFRTSEQQYFFLKLGQLKFNNDEDLIHNIRYVYERRQYLQNSQEAINFVDKVETYLLKRNICTVAHLQCYNKMKEMSLISVPFRHNLHRKYYNYLLNDLNDIRNEHMQKYLWFVFDESRFQRPLFEEAASSHTLKLHQIYQYMLSLKRLPTWQPFIRVATMLKHLGHEVKGHPGLTQRANLDKIEHRYYPYIGDLFSREQLDSIKQKQQYDDPFLSTLCKQYIIKNTSRYDSYLQRVQRVQIEKSYQKALEIMSWRDFGPLLDLTIRDFNQHGSDPDIESQVSDIFFRLTEHADIDLETITQILDKLHRNPNFMYFRRSPVISRTIDSLASKSLEQFSYFPAEAFGTLLEATTLMESGEQAVQSMQGFICKKIENKRIWNEGEIERLTEHLKQGSFKGGAQALNYLKSLEEKR